MKKTAIIIVNYKTPWHIKQCIQSVIKHSQNFHIFLVHNEPDQESILVGDKLKKENPEDITIISNKKNLGFVGGVNSAYDYAIKFDRVCFLNSDTIVTDGWLSELNNVLNKNTNVVQVSPDMSHYYDEGILATLSKKIIVRFNPQIGRYLYKFFLLKKKPRSPKQNGFKPYDNFFDFCTGACNLTRTKYFTDLGYFLEPKLVHGYGDDFDLTFYLRQFGKVGVTNKSYVFHFLNTSYNKLKIQDKLKRTVKLLNRLYVVYKWEKQVAEEMKKMGIEKLIEMQHQQEVSLILQYFGFVNLNNDFKTYISTAPANEYRKEFLN